MSEAKVTVEINDDVALLRLNDTKTLNAFSQELIDDLVAALDKAEAEARAIVITGEGRGFSSGANLGDGGIMATPRLERDLGARLESLVNPLMRRIKGLPIPFITAVNGPAAGVGCTLALAGDMIVVAEGAYFLQSYLRIGLIPGGGATYLLAASAGRVRAMEMMMLGEKISAAQALEWGLVSRVVSDADLVTTALGLAKRLANGPTVALSLLRKLAWSALDQTFEDQLDAERDAQRICGRTLDLEEGVTAFRNKRAAKFTGA